MLYLLSHHKFVSSNNVLWEYNEMEEKMKNSKTSVEFTKSIYEIYEIIGAETIVDNDIILWLKEKHIEKQLNHKTLRVATAKYFTDY